MLELAGKKCYEKMTFNVEGAEMTRNSNQATPSKLSIMRQLEYCRLSRAAELLGCDISDLVHFGETERVPVYILLNSEIISPVNFPKYTDAFPNHKAQLSKGKIIFDSNTYMRPLGLACFGRVPFEASEPEEQQELDGLDELEEQEEDELKEQEEDELKEQEELVDFGKCGKLRACIFGLWQLPPYIISDISDGKLPELEHLLIRIAAVTEDGDFAYADVNDWEFIPTVDDMYIKQADMLRVYEALNDIDNKKPLVRGAKTPIEQEAQARPSKITTISNVQTERHAANREIVLAAAIHAKHRWSDECGSTGKDWAQTVWNHENELFRTTNNGKLPLGLDVIERILGRAINQGLPHKSK